MDLLEVIGRLDEELLEKYKGVESIAFSDGEIPLKYKYLMAMAIDGVKGAVEGVRVLAKHAVDNGASLNEVSEAIRVAVYIGGASALYTIANGLREMELG
jgi:alkylhydroperoxidase/carboxymuconolactone decarboxylase family protein YurZ